MIVRSLLLYLLTLASASAATEPAILAYYTTSERGSPAALKARFSYFNQVSTDVYDVDDKGKITGRIRQDDIDFIHAKSLPVYALVSNFGGGDFNPEIAHAILSSPAITQLFIDGMTQRLAQNHYTGINLDFESLKPEDRAGYTAFVGTVAKKMHDAGYTVVLSVPAMSKSEPDNSWTGAFDLKALGGLVDVMQIMTYDQHGPWSAPGPIAGLDWVEQCVQYTASVVPSAKISMGIPAFSFDWDLTDKTKSAQLNWSRVPSLLAETKAQEQWDDATSSPYIKYTLRGHDHVAWYENAKSLGLKTKLVAKYHLGGVSVWALGQEDDSFWQALRAELFPKI